jgi:hypothetical protein
MVLTTGIKGNGSLIASKDTIIEIRRKVKYIWTSDENVP